MRFPRSRLWKMTSSGASTCTWPPDADRPRMREFGMSSRPPSMVKSSKGVQPITRSWTNAGFEAPATLVGEPLFPWFELSSWISKLIVLNAVPEAWRRARRRKKSLSNDLSTDCSKVPSYRAWSRTLMFRLMSSVPVGTLIADAEEDTSRAARPRGSAMRYMGFLSLRAGEGTRSASKRASTAHLSPSHPSLQHGGVNSVLRISTHQEERTLRGLSNGSASARILAIHPNE